MGKHIHHLFEVDAVCFIKSGEFVAIDVEHTEHFSIGYYRYDDFRFRERTACNVSRELVHIGHHLGLRFGPCRTTHSTSLTDAIARHIALERTENELSVLYEIEAYPEESKGLTKGCTRVGKYRNFIGLSADE